VEQLGAKVQSCLFVVELLGLGGREKLGSYDVRALVTFEESPAG
jgi:adenine/guanine phosphoribosyltransferase-like PRPP-binding protein